MANNFSRRRMMQTAGLAAFAPAAFCGSGQFVAAGARARYAEDLPWRAAECRRSGNAPL